MANATDETDAKWNNASQPYVEKPEAIFWCGLFILEAVLIIVGNLLTTIVFLRSKKLRKRRYYLMINLAISDTLVGALAMPLFVVQFGKSLNVWNTSPDRKVPGDVSLFFDMFAGFASIAFLAMIALERLYATLRPFSYRALKSRWYVLFTIIAWIAAGSIPSLHLIAIKFPEVFHSSSSPTLKMAMWVPFLSAFLLLICVSYAVIWRKVRIVHRSVKQRVVEKESSLSRICLLVTAMSLVAWLPFVVVNMVFELSRRATFLFHVFYIAKFLHFANSLLNPVLYVLKIPEFKAGLSGLCTKKYVRNTSGSELSVPLSLDTKARKSTI
ncbi:kappa-type opioid receptor-like [Oculina patagonica]